MNQQALKKFVLMTIELTLFLKLAFYKPKLKNLKKYKNAIPS